MSGSFATFARCGHVRLTPERPKCGHAELVAKCETQTFSKWTRRAYAVAVVGSIIFLTSVTFVAGKPLISACLRIMASSLAR